MLFMILNGLNKTSHQCTTLNHTQIKFCVCSSTEERAQAAEEKAMSYENELKEAMEKIRALERQVAKTPDTVASDVSKPVTARTPAPETGPATILTPSDTRRDSKDDDKKKPPRTKSGNKKKGK